MELETLDFIIHDFANRFIKRGDEKGYSGVRVVDILHDKLVVNFAKRAQTYLIVLI